MQSILKNLEAETGLLLAATCLCEPLSCAIRIVLTLLVELNGPALEVGVEFEHDQGKTETCGDQ